MLTVVGFLWQALGEGGWCPQVGGSEHTRYLDPGKGLFGWARWAGGAPGPFVCVAIQLLSPTYEWEWV